MPCRPQCAPLRGSYVSQTGTRAPDFQQVNTYGSCLPGYTALSGGVYLSMPDDNDEVPNGFLDYSILANGNRWYVDGVALWNTANKLVALEQSAARENRGRRCHAGPQRATEPGRHPGSRRVPTATEGRAAERQSVTAR